MIRRFLKLTMLCLFVFSPPINAAKEQPGGWTNWLRDEIFSVDKHKERMENWRREYDRKKARIKRTVDDLNNKVAQVNRGEEVLHEGERYSRVRNNVDELISQQERAQRKEAALEKRNKENEKFGREVGEKVLETVSDVVKENERAKHATVQLALHNKGKLERLQSILTFFSEPQNIGYVVAGVAGIIASYYVIKHGTRIAASQIEKRLGKPPIVKETSRKTFLGKLFGGKEEKESRLDEVIAAPALKEKLTNIADDTRNAYANGDFLSNLLLYGPPGTGKTMFSKALAYHSGLDYALIPGSSLSKLSTEEALAEFNRILDWARFSPKGTVVILDEAETFLGKRGEVSEGSRKLITEFLAQIEKPSDKKVMFVLVTNRPNDLDVAVLSRMGRCVQIPSPAQPELVGLMKLYAPKVSQFGFHLEEGLEKDFDHFAQQAYEAELTGRDIEQLFVTQISRRVRRSGKPVVTFDIVQETLDDYIQERKERDIFFLDNKAPNTFGGRTGTSCGATVPTVDSDLSSVPTTYEI